MLAVLAMLATMPASAGVTAGLCVDTSAAGVERAPVRAVAAAVVVMARELLGCDVAPDAAAIERIDAGVTHTIAMAQTIGDDEVRPAVRLLDAHLLNLPPPTNC